MNKIPQVLIQVASFGNEQRDYLSRNLQTISNIFYFIFFFILFFAVYRTGL